MNESTRQVVIIFNSLQEIHRKVGQCLERRKVESGPGLMLMN